MSLSSRGADFRWFGTVGAKSKGLDGSSTPALVKCNRAAKLERTSLISDGFRRIRRLDLPLRPKVRYFRDERLKAKGIARPPACGC